MRSHLVILRYLEENGLDPSVEYVDDGRGGLTPKKKTAIVGKIESPRQEPVEVKVAEEEIQEVLATSSEEVSVETPSISTESEETLEKPKKKSFPPKKKTTQTE
jgi:hypothetical protein